MINIKERFPDKHMVVIQVDGRLDEEALGPMKRIFNRHDQSGYKIVFSFHELTSISVEGKDYLQGIMRIRNNVTLVGMPEFLQLELANIDIPNTAVPSE
jgi:hypothetical protein